MFLVSLTRCISQTNNTTHDKQETSINNNLKTKFENINILLFSEITIDRNARYKYGSYYHLKVKIKITS